MAFRVMDATHPADAAEVQAATEAPSVWFGADPIITPVAEFLQTYGWWIVAACIIYVSLAPSVKRQVAQWQAAASLADAKRPERVNVLDAERQRVREEQAARLAALDAERREELKAKAAAKAKESAKRTVMPKPCESCAHGGHSCCSFMVSHVLCSWWRRWWRSTAPVGRRPPRCSEKPRGWMTQVSTRQATGSAHHDGTRVFCSCDLTTGTSSRATCSGHPSNASRCFSCLPPNNCRCPWGRWR